MYMVTFDYKKSPITQIADYIIMYSAKSGASDIHFDPHEDGLMVRIRIDGELRDYTLVPPDYERNLITRLKLLANMNITESRLPQDGSIKGKFGNLFLDMRVSSLPTNQGEKIVIRILDYTRSLQGLEHLGFSHTNFEKLKRMISVPNGIILVTGATGSGKSTTTYSILETLNKKEVNIITVEDPVEMSIEGLNQVQVNSEIGLDFATVLRSILRQDPNIILIGEIRDSETAKIAVRASITGHLVISTIHTNNSLSTIERLLDMGVERYLLSSALTGIISQRLAKMICPKCRIERETTEYEKKVFKAVLGKDIDKVWDANKDGCSECHHGYKDRIAVQEVLEIDDDIRLALNNEHLTKEELRNLVYTSNVITLLQDGLNKVLEGITSFEEIYRIIEIDSDITENYLDTPNVNNNDDDEPKKKDKKKKKKKKDDNQEENNESEEKEETVTEEENKDEEPSITDTAIVQEENANSDNSSEPTLVEETDSTKEESPTLVVETAPVLEDQPQIVSEIKAEEPSITDTAIVQEEPGDNNNSNSDNSSEPTLVEVPKIEVKVEPPKTDDGPTLIEENAPTPNNDDDLFNKLDFNFDENK